MKATPLQFVECARTLLGQPYLWGGNGETLGDVLRKYADAKGQGKDSTEQMIKFINKMLKADLDSVHLQDCSGFIIEVLRKLGAYKGDLTAQGLWENCTPIDKPEFGCLCFYYNGTKHNHVGICTGDDTVIHDLSTSVGIVEEKFSKRGKWVDFGRADKWIDYGASDTITLAKDVYVYNSAQEAKRNVPNEKTIVYRSGVYFIYKTYENCTNITKTKGKPGGWIYNPILYKAEEW